MAKNLPLREDGEMSDSDYLQICIDCYYRESALFWTRTNIFVIVNAGMFALVANPVSGISKYQIVAGLFGLVVSYIWYKLVEIGLHYASIWTDAADEKFGKLESNNPLRSLTAAMNATGPTSIKKPVGLLSSSADCAKKLSCISMGVWIAFLVFAAYDLWTKVPKP